MMSEDKKKYTPIDPYVKQSVGKAKIPYISSLLRYHLISADITEILYDETENEEIQIHDYSQFDYSTFRDKRQLIPDSLQDNTDSLDPEEELEPERDPTLREDEVKERFLIPLYVITGVFATMLIVGPFLVKKGPNRGIVQSSIMLSAFCMWIFWFTIYFGQMNPLMGPRLENTTVAWIAYKLGRHV